MNELFIDGAIVDLGEDTKIGITLQVNDIAEMIDRQGAFSNTFKTPKSQTNRQIYEHAEQVNATTDKPYQKLPAKYVQDGIELISNGYAEIKSAGDFYEQTIFSGILDFFSQIKGKKLSDLDLSAYDHVWNLATAFASRTNTDGYIYPLIDNSDDSDTLPYPYMETATRGIDVQKLYPAMFIHTLISKIFEATTYTFAGAITTTDKYLNRLFPFNLDKLEYEDDFIKKVKFKVGVSDSQDSISVTNNLGASIPNFVDNNSPNFTDESSLGFYDTSNLISTLIGNPYLIHAGFTSIYTSKYNFSTSINFTLSLTGVLGGTVNTDVYVKIIKEHPISIFPYHQTVILGTGTYTHSGSYQSHSSTINVIVNGATVAKGDRVYVECTCQVYATSISANAQMTFTIKKESTFSGILNGAIIFMGDVIMEGIMPSMTQEELLKSVAVQLGIIYIPDNVNKIIYFKQFQELYANKPSAINMTTKMDMSKEIKVSFRENGYAQKNWLRYKENTNVTKSGIVPTKGLGDGFFSIDDENLELEKDLFVLPFSATDNVTRLNGLSVCRIPKLNAGVMVNKTELRIVMLNRQDITGGDIIYRDDTPNVGGTLDTSISIPLTYFIDDTKLDSLGFDRFLLSSEYNEFVNELMVNFKKIEAKFKLSIKDVHNFDFFIPWYLEQYSNHFYVNKIKDFTTGRVTAVELVKM